MFINDLPRCLKYWRMWLFINDGKAVAQVDSLEEHELFQEDFSSVGGWSNDNNLPLSIHKCAVLHYGTSNLGVLYLINGVTIRDAIECSDLGVLRTNDFQYKAHINALGLRASRVCGIVFRLFSARRHQFFVRLFSTYILPT